MPVAPASPVASPRPASWATALVPTSAKDINALDATFAAGAALAALDSAVRQNGPFAGAWRRRLALKAAAASLQGRPGDEVSLRDALALTKPGGDSGPQGRVYVAWRALASGGARRLADIATGLGAPDPAALVAIFDDNAKSTMPAPIAAAAAAASVAARFPRAAPLAWAMADLVLAARLGWPKPLPLLALERARGGAHPSAWPGGPRPGDAAWSAACCAAYARAASQACDLHADLARAAVRLETVAPRLRAKGAGAAISALLDEDAVSSASEIHGISDRGLRRLFDRLVDLGAARELTGRKTFRLYGL